MAEAESKNRPFGKAKRGTVNHDFLVNDKITNSGVEHWIVCKIDGQWRIAAVVWTSYDVKN